MKLQRMIILTVLILSCSLGFAEERTSIWTGGAPKKGAKALGILFSTDDILLDIEGFQGGIGLKTDFRDWALRGSADLLLSNELNPFSINLGAVLEKHVWPGPVSLYWGPMAGAGFTTLLEYDIDDSNWQRSNTWPFAVGFVLGVEVFLFEFLSFFVEYQAALDLGITTTRTSTAGSVSSTTEFTYHFDVGMGNNAMFGIVFYLMKREAESSR